MDTVNPQTENYANVLAKCPDGHRLTWQECREIQEQWKRDAKELAEAKLADLLNRANKLIEQEKQ